MLAFQSNNLLLVCTILPLPDKPRVLIVLVLLQAGTFFHDPLRPMMNSKQLREYVVLDIEATGPSTNRLALADAQKCFMRDAT